MSRESRIENCEFNSDQHKRESFDLDVSLKEMFSNMFELFLELNKFLYFVFVTFCPFPVTQAVAHILYSFNKSKVKQNLLSPIRHELINRILL